MAHGPIVVVVAKIEINCLNCFVGLAPSPNFVNDSVEKGTEKKYSFN